MAEQGSSLNGPPTGLDTPILDLRNVHKHFPIRRGILQRAHGAIQAVSGVSLTVSRGTTLGVVGESGSGKTTLGRLIVGLERPTSGQIIFDGGDIAMRSHLEPRRHDLQMMFQDPYASLDPRMRVGATLAEPLVIQHQGSRRTRASTVRQLLIDISLPPEAAAHYPHEFSGGQRQRIGLARALALQPRLIVADEPVSGLDVSIRAQILNLMHDLQDRYGLTYLVISHDLTVVRYVSDVIAVMYLGKVVEMGPTTSVYVAPAHPYTRALLDAVPIPDPDRERGKKVVPLAGEIPSASEPPSGCRFRTRCPRAQHLCAVEEPLMRTFSDGHRAACHFPLRAAAGEQEAPGARVS